MKHRMSWILALALAVSCTACSGKQAETENADTMNTGTTNTEAALSEEGVAFMEGQTGSGQIPEELAQIPGEYFETASEQGTVERLEYQTW